MENGTNVKTYRGISILYEDNHIIVCIKPEGILSQKDSTEELDLLSILKDYLKETYNKPGNVYLGLVHRLDRRVSGVMVLAKTSKAASRLSSDIRENNIGKTYYAICQGNVLEKGTLINKLKKVDEKAVEAPDGKESILDYEKILNLEIDNKEYSLVKVLLHTGRFNQIRCQFALNNHPLINDFKYGFHSNKGNKDFSHIGLFCVMLEITHPVKKEVMTFSYDEVIRRTKEDWIKYFSCEE